MWLWEGEGLVLTDTRAPEVVHRHGAVQVVVSLGAETAMRVQGDDWVRSRGTVVASDIPHAYDSASQPTLGLWVDPSSRIGRSLAIHHVSDGDLAVLGDTAADDIVALAPEPPDRSMTAQRAREVFEGAVTALLGEAPIRDRLDPRVEAVLHRLEGELRLPPVGELAALVGLSVSHLQHLVRDELGMSLSRWLLWRRTLRGLELLVEGWSASEAAFDTGFADAPDLTRRFREFFGAPPTAAIEDPRSRIVIASRLPAPA